MNKQRVKKFLQEYFSFTARERLGVMVLLVLITLLFILPDFLPKAETDIVLEDSLISALMEKWDPDSLRERKPVTGSGFPRNYKAGDPPAGRGSNSFRLFPFDPNTATIEEWMQLGLPQKTANTIVRYREKGGRFRTPEDLDKIYGFPSHMAQRLKPYVRISARPIVRGNKTTGNSFRRMPAEKEGSSITRKMAPVVKINSADSMQWLALPGIGPALTRRILLFRDKIGGFYAVDQVAEVYGLPDSVFQLIRPILVLDKEPWGIIAINEASLEELASHPYIKKTLAAVLIRYREEHGKFSALEDLRKVHLVNDDFLVRIRPYLNFR